MSKAYIVKVMLKSLLPSVVFIRGNEFFFHIVCMQEPAVALAKKGYHILLEKPMAVSFCCSHFVMAHLMCADFLFMLHSFLFVHQFI